MSIAPQGVRSIELEVFVCVHSEISGTFSHDPELKSMH